MWAYLQVVKLMEEDPSWELIQVHGGHTATQILELDLHPCDSLHCNQTQHQQEVAGAKGTTWLSWLFAAQISASQTFQALSSDVCIVSSPLALCRSFCRAQKTLGHASLKFDHTLILSQVQHGQPFVLHQVAILV